MEVGQRVVYLVLQEILNYHCIYKPKGYDKPVVEIFAEVHFFYKPLKVIMTVRCHLFDTIAIVIIFNTLYSNFKVTIASILEIEDKTIEEI